MDQQKEARLLYETYNNNLQIQFLNQGQESDSNVTYQVPSIRNPK
jgi:hypothetical protein